MKIKEVVFTAKCDCCGDSLDDENLYPEEALPTIMSCNGWKNLGDKDYCQDCWHWDDDDNIVTKDGRKFDGETEEEIH